MADSNNNSEIVELKNEIKDLAKLLRGILIMQIRNLPENQETEKIEFTLFRAGFSRNEIADLLGKKYETVKKTIQEMKPNKKASKNNKAEDTEVSHET